MKVNVGDCVIVEEPLYHGKVKTISIITKVVKEREELFRHKTSYERQILDVVEGRAEELRLFALLVGEGHIIKKLDEEEKAFHLL